MRDLFCFKGKAPIWIAFAAYVAIHAAIQVYWATARPSPIEPDDAYTYILKAEQLVEGCGLQDCAAIEDLRRQLAEPVADPEADWLRYRMLLRTTLVYHPLYTGLMVGLGKLGLGWEEAYIAISVLGAALIGVGLCYFLIPLWGSNAAALAVALLALSSFRGQGLLYIVPSNLAFGIALFLWGAAIRGHRGWSLAALTAAALLLHPIGKLYSLAAIPMIFLMERKLFPAWRTVLICGAIMGLMMLSGLAPMLVERPQLRVLPEPWPEGTTWIGALFGNVLRALQTIATFDARSQPFATIVTAGLFLLAWRGFRESDEDQKRRVVATLVPLAALCVVSLGHVLPNYRGETFIRVWIPLAVLLAGGAAYALVGPRGLLWSGDAARLPGRLAFARVRTAGFAFVALAAASGAWALAGQIEHVRARGFETYVPTQVKRAAEDCGTVLFAGETAALFYLSHGAHRCAARYLLAMDASRRASLAEGLRTAPRPLLLVVPQPGPKQLRIDGTHPIRLDLPAGLAGEVQLKLLSERASVVEVKGGAGAEVAKINVPGDAEPQWIALPGRASGPPETFQIMSSGAKAPVYLEGIRVSDAQTTRWPWGTEVVLHPGRRSKFVFSAADLGGGLFHTLKPLDTQGSTMLAIVE